MSNESIRVLVVDDDPTLRRSLKRILTDNELIVETASGAAEANVFLNTYEFDAVLCDYNMPGQNGLEFLTELSKTHPDVIRMVLSGQVSGLEMAERWACEIGVFEIFSKPFDGDMIASKIKFAVYKRENLSPENTRTISEDEQQKSARW